LLEGSKIPVELSGNALLMTSKLFDAAQMLNKSIEKISSYPKGAIEDAKNVAALEHDVDFEYLKIKRLFLKYGQHLNVGVMVIFDDLIEFIERAADMCAETADYIVILSNRN
jgi:uncharacterized protein Yka (UPF0111/DUF47 family)